MIIGIVIMIRIANKTPGWLLYTPLYCCAISGRVFVVAFVIVHSARKNSFQQVRKVQMDTTTIPDFSSGILP